MMLGMNRDAEAIELKRRRVIITMLLSCLISEI
jgi:hypothetical protein